MDCLAVSSLVSRLPEDSSLILASQATFYLSAFESLSQARLTCLRIICNHMSSADSAELMELIAARIISTRPGNERLSITYISVYLFSILTKGTFFHI